MTLDDAMAIITDQSVGLGDQLMLVGLFALPVAIGFYALYLAWKFFRDLIQGY